MMKRLLFIIGRFQTGLWKRLSDWFWKHYLIAYCSNKKEVHLSDPKTTFFNGKTLLAVSPNGEMWIGKNVVFNSSYHTITANLSKIDVGGGVLLIGDGSGISSSTIICKEHIEIGKNVNIGAGCLILDSNMHSADWRIRANRENDCPENATKKPIYIEDNVFIGAQSIICKGVRIGAKTMIAAGSVVVKDIPANCIAGGNPCIVLKQLSDE